MQSHDTVHITPPEWRWVLFFAIALVTIAFLPFLWIALSGLSGGEWQFMGLLNNYRDGATYLSKMTQGMEGEWLLHFQHTPENHNGAFIQIIYPALGQITRLIDLQPLVVFHAARVLASLFMYVALYQFGASIWLRVRTRRIFFVLVSISAGVGWFVGPLAGNVTIPDLTIPEIFPFQSSLVNVHFPLTVACLALLASVIILAFRPGADGEPNVSNGGLTAILLSLALALLYPQALVPLGAGLTIYILINWIRRRKFSERDLRWLLVVGLPALPVAVYYVAVVNSNSAIAEWNSQNVTSAPPPHLFILGLGLVLIVALPGIFRAFKHFEPDGDQFMLVWLLTMVVVIYLPTNIQRRFAVGMMIPIAYFATRALEDFWFQRINRRWRYRLLVVALPFMALSHLFVLVLPVLPLVSRDPSQAAGLFLPQDYRAAFTWIKRNSRSEDVVLAAPDVSIWLPGWTGARVVYGHPFETLGAAAKEKAVLDWYSETDAADCQAIFTERSYSVRYVLVGPQEQALGESVCIDALTLVSQFGHVGIYAP